MENYYAKPEHERDLTDVVNIFLDSLQQRDLKDWSPEDIDNFSKMAQLVDRKELSDKIQN